MMVKPMRILHLASNDKFIFHAYRSFENVFPGRNEVRILHFSALASQFKPNPEFKTLRAVDLINPFFLNALKNYDCVVLHSLLPHFISLLNHAPRSVKFIWIGWGFDYYSYIYADPALMLLPETRKIARPPQKKNPFKTILKSFLGAGDIEAAFKKIAVFSPVLPEEHELVCRAGILKNIPAYKPWNYGSLEETLIKGFEGQRVKGRSILVGNSADIGNNHIDAFRMLQNLDVEEVICPLSYGDKGNTQAVIDAGRTIFGDRFKYSAGFLPLEEYMARLQSCGFVVMNHVRQQGLGTVVQMMYLGAKVFLREESPAYLFLKSRGAHVFAVQELQNTPALLQEGLTESQIEANIEVLRGVWSKDATDRKTFDLVTTVCRGP